MNRLTGLTLLLLLFSFALLNLAPLCDDDDDTGDDDLAGDDDAAPVECPPVDSWQQWSPGADVAPGVWAFFDPNIDVTWHEATALCDELNAINYCGFGNWRLPTISELRSIIVGCPSTVPGGSCNVSDECLSIDPSCNDTAACWDACTYEPGRANGPGPYGQYSDAKSGFLGWQWSGSVPPENENAAWLVMFDTGSVVGLSKDNSVGMHSGCIAP